MIPAEDGGGQNRSGDSPTDCFQILGQCARHPWSGHSAQYCFLCVPEGDGRIGKNEPLRPLKSAEFTDKIMKISGFSDPQCVSGSTGESSRKLATCLQLGAK
jgi:hypothetical protein